MPATRHPAFVLLMAALILTACATPTTPNDVRASRRERPCEMPAAARPGPSRHLRRASPSKPSTSPSA